MMEKIVFNQDFIGESILASILGATKLDENETQNMSKHVDLIHLKNIYAKFIVKDKSSFEHTKFLWSRNVFSLPSLILNSHGETLLPGRAKLVSGTKKLPKLGVQISMQFLDHLGV